MGSSVRTCGTGFTIGHGLITASPSGTTTHVQLDEEPARQPRYSALRQYMDIPGQQFRVWSLCGTLLLSFMRLAITYPQTSEAHNDATDGYRTDAHVQPTYHTHT